MIDTAFKLTIAAETLKKAGATEVYAIATHAVFSGNAQQRLQDSPIAKVIVTDSINIAKADQFEKLEVVSVGNLFGEAIRLIHNQHSVGRLFGR
jgi:ribose-phosphate pyrophosphokinase